MRAQLSAEQAAQFYGDSSATYACSFLPALARTESLSNRHILFTVCVAGLLCSERVQALARGPAVAVEVVGSNVQAALKQLACA